jgi:mono/diheme cytochrome c family protein
MQLGGQPNWRFEMRQASTLPLFTITLVASALAAGPARPLFERDILPIFSAKCFGCHNGKVAQAGLSLETRDSAVKGGKTGSAIVPGRSVDSLLLSMISTGRMPMGSAPLSTDEIQIIRGWIDSGALKEGETALARNATEGEVLSTILGAKCFVCHGRRTQEAGLDLRSRASMMKGGKSGPAIVPGNPEESLLFKKIASQQMPPAALQEQFSVRAVTSDELDKVRQWIAAGAPADTEKPLEVKPESDPLVKDTARNFWSFRSSQRPEVPRVRNTKQIRNPIDAFLLEKLEEKGLRFSEEAEKRVLARRAYFDLIGLPPSPQEVQAFLADRSPQAYERLIDHLLDSPHYGERWARYWLEAAGYADSEGGANADAIRPFAYRYRDYVIRSLNADKPYNEFLVEQLAGDELFDYKLIEKHTPEQADKLIATGFLRLTRDSTYNTELNFMPDRLDAIADEMEVIGSSVLGLTLGCARCHDHKYDPIPQRDYYRLNAIFRTAYDPYDWLIPNLACSGVGASCKESDARFLPLKTDEAETERREIELHNAAVRKRIEEMQRNRDEKTRGYSEQLRIEKLGKAPVEIRAPLTEALSIPEADRNPTQQELVRKYGKDVEVTPDEVRARFKEYQEYARKITGEIQKEKGKLKLPPLVRALFDMGGEPTPVRVLLRGDFNNPGPLVEPGVPSVLSAGLEPYRVEKPPFRSGTSGRRLALARWLVQPNHPLTSRVIVNRIWQDHFGEGLVRSPGNFGSTGVPPTHPKLLDWLATEFVSRDWRMKTIHRLIMTSAAYRQRSLVDASAATADPDHTLLSHFPLRRLDSDALRDAILKSSDFLDPQLFGSPVELEVRPDGEVLPKTGKGGQRRSIYLLQQRTTPVSILDIFDAPFLSPNCVKRDHSTVPSQALNLMNSQFVLSAARRLAARLIDSVGDDTQKQIGMLYLTAFGRDPSGEERQAATAALASFRKEWRTRLESEKILEPVSTKAPWLALADLCHMLFNSAEFLYVD